MLKAQVQEGIAAEFSLAQMLVFLKGGLICYDAELKETCQVCRLSR